MSKPLVSVVIPVYNRKKELKDCVESILQQDFKDFEIIIVDNNSTDGTSELIKDFCKKSKKIKYVFEKIKIRGAARNTGVKNASGEIIVFIDSDCIALKSWLKKITGPIINKKEVAVQGWEVPGSLNFWAKQYQINSEKVLDNINDGGYVSLVDTKNFAILKKNLLEVGNFNREIHVGEDMDIFFKLLNKKIKIKFVDIRVKHFHRNTFLSVMKTEFCKGVWLFEMRNRYPKLDHSYFWAITPKGFFLYVPYIVHSFFLGKYTLSEFIFEFIYGFSWRAGIFFSFAKKLFHF